MEDNVSAVLGSDSAVGSPVKSDSKKETELPSKDNQKSAPSETAPVGVKVSSAQDGAEESGEH